MLDRFKNGRGKAEGDELCASYFSSSPLWSQLRQTYSSLLGCVVYNKRVLASDILSSKTLPEPIKREETVDWYPWTIDNKYYTADVRLCVVPSTFHMSPEIAQSMQAFIAYFDSSAVRDLRTCRSLIILTV